jgi:uncharacterized membrane protein
MKAYLPAVIRAFWWSLFIALLNNHVMVWLNPFQGVVLLAILLIAVIVQVVMLWKRGFVYVVIFVVSLVVLTALLMYLDNALLPGPRRYYGIK